MKIDATVSRFVINQMQKSDRLARSFSRWGLTFWKAALILFGYGVIYSIILPLFSGELPQVLQDWPTLVIFLCILPLLLGYYLWQMQSIQSLYDALTAQIADKKLRQKASLPFAHLFSHSVWFWVAVGIGILQCVYIFYDSLFNRIGWQSHLWMVIAVLPLRFISFYAIVFILSRQIIAIVSIKRLLDIYPQEAVLQFDANAGLFALGRYVLSIGIVAGLVGLILGLTLLRVRQGLDRLSVEFAAEIVFYLVTVPILFLVPLWKAHLLMGQTRQSVLDEIEAQTSRQFGESLDKMRSGKLGEADGDRLGALQLLYEKTKRLPTWPLNVGIVSRFSAAVILPILAPIGLDLITRFVESTITKVP